MGSGCLKPTCYGHQILDQIARNLWKIFLKIDYVKDFEWLKWNYWRVHQESINSWITER